MPPEPMRRMREVRMEERREGGRAAWSPRRIGGMLSFGIFVDVLSLC